MGGNRFRVHKPDLFCSSGTVVIGRNAEDEAIPQMHVDGPLLGAKAAKGVAAVVRAAPIAPSPRATVEGVGERASRHDAPSF